MPFVGRDGRRVRSRSLLVPWALILGAGGVWATAVFADIVHDMLIHSLWGDILFSAGALELARRRGIYERPWLDAVLPVTFVSCGALFLVHVAIDPTGQGSHWHLAMGLLLITGGTLELLRLWRRRAPLIPLAVLPLTSPRVLVACVPRRSAALARTTDS